MASLAEIRARIQAQDNKTQKGSSGPSDNSIYPHWNAEEGTTAIVRFLPDGNPNNTFFWVERQLIRLDFNGVKGGDNKKVSVTVPCMEMYGEQCPVLTEVRPWFKDPTLEDMGRKYWKKRSYLFQGFVRQNPMGDDNPPSNPIRRFIISPQIFAIIKSSLMDPEMEELPTDYMRGIDFNIKKTSKGGYSDYSTSNWARKESSLTEVEQSSIDSFGLFNLQEFLPKKPNEAEINVIKEMFEASVNGEAYDIERWGAYFKPYGVDVPESVKPRESAPVAQPVQSQPVQTQASAPEVMEDDEVPFAASSPIKVPNTSTNDKAADILAMIRARQTKTS